MTRGFLIDPVTPTLYLNQGEAGFKPQQLSGLASKELGAIGMAVEQFDYDRDGSIDVILGNERGQWHLLHNELPGASSNRKLRVLIGTSEKGGTPLGAKVELIGCDSEQIRRVGATGSMYSGNFDQWVYFGLGSCKKQVLVRVFWTDGSVADQRVEPTRWEVTF